MRAFIKYLFGIGIVLFVLTWVSGAVPHVSDDFPEYIYSPDTPSVAPADTDSLHYPIQDRYGDPLSNPDNNPLDLKTPSNVTTKVEYDPDENEYDINEKMGTLDYRPPSYMTFDEYVASQYQKSTHDYWLTRANEEDKIKHGPLIAPIKVPGKAFQKIFGSDIIDIRPQGSAELIFALNVAKNHNPNLPVSQQTVSTFDFKEKIQMNVTAAIGDKMKLATNYNTEATFDFENKMKLQYTGHEDEIIKDIEAGNITFPLSTTLIQGSQSLFGIKTKLQFGALTVTSVFSQQKGKSSTITVQGGAQTSTFDIKADQYEANKHYFLAEYFANQYDYALAQTPVIRSQIVVTKVEVWVTNKTGVTTNTRNIFAFMDLGENKFDSTQTLLNNNFPYNQPLPSDSSNNLFQYLLPGGPTDTTVRNIFNGSSILAKYETNNFTSSKNWEKVENARLLGSNEFTFNPLLGYISLNQALNADEVLGVAFQYTINGQVFQVGDFSTDGINPPNALFVKMLKGTITNTHLLMWDLMMKNIYALNGYNINPKNFRCDVLYLDDNLGTRVNFIPEGCGSVKGIPLISLLNCDKMNSNRDPFPDGIYDVLDGVTISLANGRIILPIRKPFGEYLQTKFCNDAQLAKKFCFNALYDSTKFEAQQQPQLDKFSLRGSYTGASNSDISLNATNIPQGSVVITAGGITLKENIDYTVDYTLGRVKIINAGYLNSNTPLQITLESNSLFNIQTKTEIGSRFDYVVNKDFTLGGTILHLSELPLTQKVSVGDEPISNTIWGLDGTYRTDSRFLTKMIDHLPFIATKEPSNVTMAGEFADLMPGHAKAIGSSGTSYIDDFEGAVTPLDVKNPGSWYLASTPQFQSDLFPEGNLSDSLPYGYNRSLLAWYIIDPLFQQQINGLTPAGITTAQMNNNYVREIPQTEIFPNESTAVPTALTCLNLAFYPNQRGPYNYDAVNVNSDGTMKAPSSRWGGIMRAVPTNDFEAANIDELDFWLMDPFDSDNPEAALNPHSDNIGGDLYFNIGDISEDVLRDSHKSFENGLPAATNNYTAGTSVWGQYPEIQSVVNAFDNDESSRAQQDVGLDGLGDAQEKGFFANYLNALKKVVSPAAYQNALNDPSTDDYHYFQGTTYDQANAGAGLPPLQRYKKYNGMEGNSPVPPTVDGFTATETNIPDAEDINRDNNMNETESYFQYHIRLVPSQMVVGQNDIADMITSTIQGQPGKLIKWYEFKVPLHQPDRVVNGIKDFKSIRFMRMFLKGWQDSVVCRFAQLQFERSNWIKYESPLPEPGGYISPTYPGNTTFDESSVSIVENGNRQPINYVLPPGITREVDPTTQTLVQLDEASLSLQVCNLQDGDARAVYKNLQLDIRKYGQLQMYVHAEGANQYLNQLKTGDLSCFIRLGSDFTDNYYEYEIPLTMTQSGQNDPDQVWPTANNIDIDLAQLVAVKEIRNTAVANGTQSLIYPFVYPLANGIVIRVVGSPNLGNVQTAMIGVRNPLKTGRPNDNGASLCGEIWVDELRLTNFNEEGGWAANVHVSAKLADLGTATLAGTHSTAGFGALESTIATRSLNSSTGYDFSTNLELGKFIPKKIGLHVPFFFGYSETFITPEYNPLDPDVYLNNAIDAVSTTAQKDSIKNAALDYTLRKSLNFTNVKKTKTGGGKAHVWDVENLTFSYAYTEALHHDVDVASDLATTTKSSLSYNFTNTPKNVTPFRKSKLFKSKYFRPIRDFNFYYAPSTIAIRYDLERDYEETRLRNISDLVIPETPTFNKSFFLNRAYSLKYDLTKSLKFDFSSNAQATIDEPQGAIDTQEKRDSVIHNLLNGGRLTNYHQTANLNYTVPLNKFPIFDWITLTTRYGADYGWAAGPLVIDSASGQLEEGPNRNTINNAQNESVNGQFNMVNLYNKIDYLKKLNSAQPHKKPVRPPASFFKPKTAADSLKLKLYRDSLARANNPLVPIMAAIAKLAMSVKTVGFTYTETNAMSFPGFIPTPYFLGNNWGGSIPSPGLDFIAGSQNAALFKQRFSENGWLGTDTNLNAPFSQSNLKNFAARATIEPIKNFKIELTANRNYSLSESEYFRYDPVTGRDTSYNPLESGNFSMSFLSYNTAFVKDNSDYSNKTFETFSNDRMIISARLAAQNHFSNGKNASGFYDGYGPDQQDVLTLAFLAAYAGKSAGSVSTNEFPSIPLPNWRITYDGLSKLPALQKIFSNVNLSSGYRSAYSVGGFTQNLYYSEEEGLPVARDVDTNFIPHYTFQTISIAEQFSPLIGIDVQLKNSMSFRFELKQDRTVSLSFANAQVTEIRGKEYDFGTGYKIHKFKIPFIGTKPLKGDLDLKVQFDLRDNTTIIRQLDLNTNQPVAGTEIEAIDISADYIVNPRFTVKLFVITTINTPFVSLTYPTANTNAGFSLRFSLAQ